MNIFYRIFTDFPFGLMVAELLFSRYYSKRRRFWLRAATALPVFIGYALVANGTGSSGFILLDRLAIFLLMAATGVWIRFCHECSMDETLFCLLASYAVQNIHHNLAVNLVILMENQMDVVFSGMTSALFSVLLMVLIYGTADLILITRMKDADLSHIDRTRMMTNGIFFLLMTLFFIPDLPETFSETRLLNFLYYIAADSLMLFSLFGLLKESRQTRELAVLEQLLHAENRQMKTTKETIDIINMKCHDLKHQIALLRGKENDAFVREIEDAVQIYDSSVKTGNKTLDIILMEKLLHCEKHRIQLTCIADGEKLRFMSSSDIYSLFGNALDNAIESVLKEADEEKRVISISVTSRDQLLKIHVENYVGDQPVIQEGLPVTTKADKKYHGFGMMSIQHIVQKYGGEMSIRVENHIFTLNIILPLG